MFKSIFCSIQPKFRTILTAKSKSWPYNTYCTNGSQIKVVDFCFVKKIAKEPEKLLIDVRTPAEIEDTGRIPGSINIPLDNLYPKLGSSTTQTEFSSQFGRKKPSSNTQIIFSCRSGKRAQKSAEKAIELGYTNVWVYEGSWIDWQKRINDKCDSLDKE